VSSKAGLHQLARLPITWVGALFFVHLWWLFDVVTGARTLFTRDVLFFILPFKAEAARVLAGGGFPWLSHALMGGMPLWAHPSAEIADPTTLIFTLLPPWTAFGWATLVHGVAAGLGVVLVARRLGAGAVLSGWAGIAYAGAGPVLSMWPIKAVPSVALPWVVLGGALMARNPGRTAWLVTSLSVAYSLLHPDPPAVASAAACALLVCGARAPQRHRVRAALNLAAAGVLGLLIAGVFVVPSVLVVMDSPRSAAMEWSAATGLGRRWLELLAPGGFGVPGASGALVTVFNQADTPGLFVGSLYVGASVLVGLLAALAQRARTERFLFAGICVFLLLAHGDAVPGASPLWSVVHARFPEKLLLPVLLLAVVLAARGFRWISTSRQTGNAWLAGVAVGALGFVAAPLLAAALGLNGDAADLFNSQLASGAALLFCVAGACRALVWKGYRAEIAAVVLAAGVLEGFLSSSAVLLTAPVEELTGQASWVSPRIVPGQGVACCDPTRPIGMVPTAASPLLSPWSAALEKAQRMAPTTGTLHGFRYPVTSDVGGFEPASLRALLMFVLPSLDQADALRLLERWGVTWMFSTSAMPGSQLVDRAPHPPMYALEMTSPAARVEVHQSWLQLASVDAAVRAVARGDTRLALNAEGPLPVPAPQQTPVLAVVDVGDARVHATVDALSPVMVLHTALFRDGWSVTVDGAPTPLVLANGIHMAVPVQPGHHVIEFTYRMPGRVAGTAISLIGVILLALRLRRR